MGSGSRATALGRNDRVGSSSIRPFHDAELAAAREHLAAVAGNDARHEVGVFLVLDGIDDPRPGDPIGGHRNLLCASPSAADTLLANGGLPCRRSSTFRCRWRTTWPPILPASARKSSTAITARRR